MPLPTLGRIVIYVFTAEDAEKINRRRTDGPSIAARINKEEWPLGAQAHIGNPAHAGQTVPMVITKVPDSVTVNGQCLLDGNDTFWATEVPQSDGPMAGTWHWPPRGVDVLTKVP